MQFLFLVLKDNFRQVMTTEAIIFMLFTQFTIVSITSYFFYRVLRKK